MNTWQLVQQAATLPAANHHADEWTSRDDSLLIQLRSHGLSIAEIARRLGRTYYAVSTRSQVLGIAQPRAAVQAHTGPTACAACWLVHAGECR